MFVYKVIGVPENQVLVNQLPVKKRWQAKTGKSDLVARKEKERAYYLNALWIVESTDLRPVLE